MADRIRTFLRGITSETYTLDEFRRRQRAVPRVRKYGTRTQSGHSGGSEHDSAWWVVGPGDDPFVTQTLEAHFVEIAPGQSNQGHGHQNEAAFYIIDGTGYEIHDDQRYEWATGDLVIVHADCVHRHWNLSETKPFQAIVMKAKTAYMYMGLMQQGKGGPIQNPEAFSDRVDWSPLWVDGVLDRKKVIKPDDGAFEDTAAGRIRVLAGPDRPDVRMFSVDVRQEVIEPGKSSSRRWQMGDEIVYVIQGTGSSRHWDVEVEIAEKYYAHIAKEPSSWEFEKGDVMYMPPNTVYQHTNTGSEPLVLLTAQNTIFQAYGYRRYQVLEPARG